MSNHPESWFKAYYCIKGTLMHEDTDEAQHQLWEEQQAQLEESQSVSTVASQLSQKASAMSQVSFSIFEI